MSPEILHKTEAGVIALNVAGDKAVRAAYERLVAAAAQFRPEAPLQGVLCQKMVEDAVAEVIVGILNDPQWGPAVVFGTGGVLVEALGDRLLAIPPLDPAAARAMILQTRGSRLLEGFRGRPRADIEALVRLIVSVGEPGRGAARTHRGAGPQPGARDARGTGGRGRGRAAVYARIRF